jgi:hypothetical protein
MAMGRGAFPLPYPQLSEGNIPMALEYNLNNIHNSGLVCFREDGTMRADTYNLIWASMAVDLGKITKENIKEWKVRLKFLAIVDQECGSWDAISEELLTMHIGLSTNVANATRAKFKKKMIDTVERKAIQRARYDANHPTLVQVG